MNHIEKLRILEQFVPGWVADSLRSNGLSGCGGYDDAEFRDEAVRGLVVHGEGYFCEYHLKPHIEAVWAKFHDKAQAETFALPADFQGDAQ